MLLRSGAASLREAVLDFGGELEDELGDCKHVSSAREDLLHSC